MDPSRQQAKEREFFDVHPGTPQGRGVRAWWTRFLHRRKQTVNLHPGRFRRYRRFVPLAIGATALVAAFVAVRLFTKAEVQDFYPSLCLGTWENAAGASGAPENFDPSLAAEGFTHENSAIYRLPGSEIFCGGFLAPSEEVRGNITNVALTFIWRVGELPPPEVPVGVVETPPTVPEEPPAEGGASGDAAPPNENGTSASEATSPTSPVEPPTPESSGEAMPAAPEAVPSATPESAPPAPVPTPTPELAPPPPPESGAPSARSAPSFFSFVFGRAFAQEEAVVGSSNEPAPTEPPAPTSPSVEAPTTLTDDIAPSAEPTTPAPAVEPPAPAGDVAAQEPVSVVLPPITTELAPVQPEVLEGTNASSTGEGPVSFEPPLPPPPDENFLKVSYSVDGEAWFEIGKVNMANWQNFTARLPVSRWDELKRLQISVQGIPTTLNPVPPVYLAGMFVEVNYELPPLLANEEADIVAEDLPVFALPDVLRTVPGRGEAKTFGAGERVEFDLDLADLPGGEMDQGLLAVEEPTEPAPADEPAPSSTPPVSPMDSLPGEGDAVSPAVPVDDGAGAPEAPILIPPETPQTASGTATSTYPQEAQSADGTIEASGGEPAL